MKKTMSIMMLLATVLLTACSNNSNTTQDINTSSLQESMASTSAESNDVSEISNQNTKELTDSASTNSEDEIDSLKAELENNYGITEPMSFARGDATGKWKVERIYTNVPTRQFAVDYAKIYMQSGDIHFIVDFYLNTTTMLRLNNNILDVRTTEYVDKEEHDASLIGNGMLLSEESYDMTNGRLFATESDENAGTASPDDLIAKVREAIDGSVGKDEKITDVVLNGSALTIFVDLSKAETSILSAKDIALMRISSIADDILDLDDQYMNAWETIVLDFGQEGKATLNKGMIINSGYGKYFEFTDDILK